MLRIEVVMAIVLASLPVAAQTAKVESQPEIDTRTRLEAIGAVAKQQVVALNRCQNKFRIKPRTYYERVQ